MRVNVQEDIIITDLDRTRLAALRDRPEALSTALLDRELLRATVVEQRNIPPDVVTMNSEIVFEDWSSGARQTLRLVYPDDADSTRGWISILEPLGTALLGLRSGQWFVWDHWSGAKCIFVVELRYQPESAGDLHL